MAEPIQIVFAAGGTGGHIFPALAVAEAAGEILPVKVLFVGTGKELERRIVGAAGYELTALSLAPVTGRGKLGLLAVVLSLPYRMWCCLRLFSRIKPAVVYGFGGYPSVLPILSACCLRIPCVIHEQNAEVGLANRLLGLFAKRIFAARGALGFWGGRDKGVVTVNNPVRKVMSEVASWKAPNQNEPLRLLILGGSQGAVSVNSAVIGLLPELKKRNLEIVHQSGESDFERVSKAYEESGFRGGKVVAFLSDMAAAYANAHLVVSRAGAMSAAEISATARPAIYIPLPIARAHQRENVRFQEEFGAAVVVEQDSNFAHHLERAILAIIDDPERLRAMATRAEQSRESETERSAAQIARAGLIAAGCLNG